MRRLFDPRDGWPVITRRQFVGEVALAFLIVTVLWLMTLFAYGLGAPVPSSQP